MAGWSAVLLSFLVYLRDPEQRAILCTYPVPKEPGASKNRGRGSSPDLGASPGDRPLLRRSTAHMDDLRGVALSASTPRDLPAWVAAAVVSLCHSLQPRSVMLGTLVRELKCALKFPLFDCAHLAASRNASATRFRCSPGLLAPSSSSLTPASIVSVPDRHCSRTNLCLCLLACNPGSHGLGTTYTTAQRPLLAPLENSAALLTHSDEATYLRRPALISLCQLFLVRQNDKDTPTLVPSSPPARLRSKAAQTTGILPACARRSNPKFKNRDRDGSLSRSGFLARCPDVVHPPSWAAAGHFCDACSSL